MDLVNEYGLKNVEGSDFELTFSIPDNCNYTLKVENKINFVVVELTEGETQPSTTFLPYHLSLSPVDSCIEVNFEQIFDNAIAKKPKITMQGC